MRHILESFGASFGFHGVSPMGAFRHRKVALIADELNGSCLAFKCQARDVTPLNSNCLLWL